jgi:hypothetical protein
VDYLLRGRPAGTAATSVFLTVCSRSLKMTM